VNVVTIQKSYITVLNLIQLTFVM